MALDSQTIAMTPDYVPYERPPQPQTLWSAIPRGLQSFVVPTTILDAKALNDEFDLTLTATLPPNFGYVFMDANFTISQNRAGDWDNRVNLNLQSFYRTTVDDSLALSSSWVQDFTLNGVLDLSRAMDASQPWPSFPMIGTPGSSGILVRLSAWNTQAAAALAGTVNSYIAFWQFDLEQIRKYPINSPFPVHAR